MAAVALVNLLFITYHSETDKGTLSSTVGSIGCVAQRDLTGE